MYRFSITIDKTKVQGTNTNFPLLFSEGSTSIPSGFWTHVTDTTTGLDIRFFDTDGITELKREVVYYSAGTSKVEAWVQIPSLGTATNKVIYCQYGGPTRANDTVVWTALSAKGVYHLNGNPNESSAALTGTVVNATTTTSGKFESAYAFAGNGYIYRTDSDNAQDITGSYTLSAWIKPSSLTNTTFLGKRIDGTGTHNYLFVLNTSGNLILYNNGISPASLTSSGTVTNGAWNHVVGVFDGSNRTIYINGSAAGTQGTTGTPTADNGPFGIGADYPASWNDFFSGTIDEVRVLSTAVSADWVATEYANQNSPSTFFSCSAEELVARTYRFPITIDSTKVSGTNTNFPYLFSDGCYGIPTGFWGHVSSSTGLDIRFFDSDGLTELKREVVVFTAGTNKVEAWVQIPSLGTASNKLIYCQYGGPTRANDTTVWSDAGYKAVYHLQGNANDSVYSNTGSVTGATVTSSGKIESAYSFDGSDYISVPNTSNIIADDNSYVLSAWVYLPDSAQNAGIMSKRTGSGSFPQETLSVTGTNSRLTGSGRKIGMLLRVSDSVERGAYTDSDYATGTWRYVVGVADKGAGTVKIYVDGSPVTVTVDHNSGTWPVVNNTDALLIGASGSLYLDGTIDEARVSKTVPGDNWVATEYANQNAPSTFSSSGVETDTTKTYRFSVTINNSRVTGTNTNFPYFFSEGCSGVPNGFWAHVSNTSGLDIRFFDTDGVTELKRDIVAFDHLNKKVEAWVQIPSLTSAYSKVIYCQYGGATRASDTSLWTDYSRYLVYHAQETTGNAINSATPGTYDGTVDADVTRSQTGLISNCFGYGTSDARINAGNVTQMNSASKFSYSCIINITDNNPVVERYAFIKYVGASDTTFFRIESGTFRGAIGATSVFATFSSSLITINTNHHLHIEYDGTQSGNSSRLKIYLDGSLVTLSFTGTVPATTTATSGASLNLYGYPGESTSLLGKSDEARFGSTILGASWIATEYANQAAPSTFSTAGIEQVDNVPSYKFSITIDRTKVTGTHTNFPFLFTETCSGLPSTFWSHVKNSSGSDIRFFDSDGGAELKREIVLFDYTNSKVEAWVQIPSLSSSANKTIYCQYGGYTRANDTTVWSDINASNVYHFYGNAYDSIGSNNGTVSGAAQIDGKIQKAYSFNGSSNYIELASNIDMNLSSITMSAWINPTILGQVGQIFGRTENCSSSVRNWKAGSVQIRNDNGVTGRLEYWLSKTDSCSGGYSIDAYGPVSALSAGSWQHVAIVITSNHTHSTRTVIIYVNGSVATQDTLQSQLSDGASVQTAGSKTSIGAAWRQDSYNEFFQGAVEELRFAAATRSADWVATEYANQNAPGTFAFCGSESSATKIYRFPITIDRTKVSGTNTNFPYLFSDGISNIPTGFWGRVADSSGLDVRFYDTDGSTELKREIVTFNSVTKKIEAWVQIPSLGSASNKNIYCQYGGAARASDTAMWTDLSARAVYHLQANANDSSVAGNTGTVVDAVNAAAKIGNGYTLDGSGDYITVANNISFASPYTLSAWVYSNSTPSNTNTILSKTNAYTTNGMEVEWLACTVGVKQSLQWFGSSFETSQSNTMPTQGQWNHFAVSYNGTTVQYYLNGSPDGSATPSAAPPTTSLTTYIGSIRPRNTGYDLAGKIDEVKIIGSTLSDGWVLTEYNNQNAPATFSYCGAEEPSPKGKFQIKIDRTKVQGTLINFPYLFTELTTSLPASFWKGITDSYGLDVRFYDSDKITELKREITLLDTINYKIEAWVQIPTLSSSADKYIWCTFGGNSRPNDQSMWTDIGAKAIYHMQGNASDASGLLRAGTVSGAVQIAGKIQMAYDFDGTDGISVPMFDYTNQFILSCWMKSTSSGGQTLKNLIAKGNTSGTEKASIAFDYSGYGAGKLFFDCVGTASSSIVSAASVNDGVWHHVLAKRDGNNFTLYLDGASTGTPTTAAVTTDYDNELCEIGRFPAVASQFMVGQIEEVRILTGSFVSSIGADWAYTEYNNQNNPATFSQCSPATSNVGKMRQFNFG